MSHKFNTFEYRNCYGKSPCGTGCWILAIKNKRGGLKLCYAPYGTFALAKEYAREYFRDYPDAVIYVIGTVYPQK
jgi:hypothetical protein